MPLVKEDSFKNFPENIANNVYTIALKNLKDLYVEPRPSTLLVFALTLYFVNHFQLYNISFRLCLGRSFRNNKVR